MTNNHAIVIGGSMAGLVVARILSDRFLAVTLIERDQFPEEAIPRKGTPQSRHIHVLLLQGQFILEKLFPGLREEMIAAGAQLMDVAADWIWLNPAGWGVRFPSDLFILSFSRDLLTQVAGYLSSSASQSEINAIANANLAVAQSATVTQS
ncbi:MAG: FAD-dependent oxidoreductase [Scytonema hyalinum WJT4-NPBG1]|jgi:2-polyprenyl-6-methoxyphenol hydroxylase-like FAD-dependent oxidoreductase|nr:FAD-dependent oxidoreductase [Scytonema hyalinum WJT4-NPBG1]